MTPGEFCRGKLEPYTLKSCPPSDTPYSSMLCGLELEVENVHIDPEDNLHPSILTIEEDGSLRNGREIILRPMSVDLLAITLPKIFSRYNITSKNYSHRCSTHFHVGVHNHTMSQVRALCLIYQVYEDLLFKWVGNDRATNIFCVAWENVLHDLNMFNAINDSPWVKEWLPYIRNWPKYTALNLAPLVRYGTIEFRHMHGTADVQKLVNWGHIIGAMWAKSLRTDLNTLRTELGDLNNTSQYVEYTINELGPTFAGLVVLNALPEARKSISKGILHMKYLLGAN